MVAPRTIIEDPLFFHSFAGVLSILIPEFKTDVRRLVTQLSSQAETLCVPYEILVLDDASGEHWLELNTSILQLKNCFIIANDTNCGRAATRNKLARKAKYNYLIFLDADVQIQSPEFLKNYLNLFSEERDQVFYGSCIYPPQKPVDEIYLLHWMYGTKIENPNLNIRQKNPYRTFHTVNFAVKNSIILKFPFDENIRNYGHEDYVWACLLKQHGIAIIHIDNPVVHEGIYSTRQFLRNTVSAVRNSIKIHKSNKGLIQTKLTKLADYIYLLRLHQLCLFLYKKLEKTMIRNLRGRNPNLWSLQIFKLGIYLRFWSKS
ncbi:MAG: glycosyltransferase family 2 protein [Saprospiraceae bacterium]|nr:glycosyltransferase family 2 protein [Saprospiraceae bacterium]